MLAWKSCCHVTASVENSYDCRVNNQIDASSKIMGPSKVSPRRTSRTLAKPWLQQVRSHPLIPSRRLRMNLRLLDPARSVQHHFGRDIRGKDRTVVTVLWAHAGKCVCWEIPGDSKLNTNQWRVDQYKWHLHRTFKRWIDILSESDWSNPVLPRHATP